MAKAKAISPKKVKSPKKAGKVRKEKKVKDPNAPKRAWSAFFFFCDEHRNSIKSKHPDWRVGDIAKELGRMWEACKDKTKFESKAKADKARYERDMAAYNKKTGKK